MEFGSPLQKKLKGNGIIHGSSNCLLTADKFQALPRISGIFETAIDAVKLYVADRLTVITSHVIQTLPFSSCATKLLQVAGCHIPWNNGLGFLSPRKPSHAPPLSTYILMSYHVYYSYLNSYSSIH